MRPRLPAIVEAIEPRRLLSADLCAQDELLDSQPSETVVAQWKQPAISRLRGHDFVPLRDGNVPLWMELAWFEGNLPIDHYTVTIDWGDGTTSAGAFERMGLKGYRVLGTHEYASPGEYRAAVSIVTSDGQRYRHGLTVLPYGQPMHLMHQSELEEPQEHGTRLFYNVFFYPSLISNIDAITATIDWGDGTVMQYRLSEIWSGAMAGMMWHDYATPGAYQVTFTATGPTYDGDVAALVISKSVELLGYHPPEAPGEWAVLLGGDRVIGASETENLLVQAPPTSIIPSNAAAFSTSRGQFGSIAGDMFDDEHVIDAIE